MNNKIQSHSFSLPSTLISNSNVSVTYHSDGLVQAELSPAEATAILRRLSIQKNYMLASRQQAQGCYMSWQIA